MHTRLYKTALAIDDDFEFCTSLKLMLRMCGFANVETAGDGHEALDKLAMIRFDLIVCDWNMHPLDGLEVLQIVRNMPSIKDIPFILVTANFSEMAWKGAIVHGASEFLTKPFSLSDLRSACRLCMSFPTADNVTSLQDRLRHRRFLI